MAITAASVEANGWVLRLTLSGSLSSAIVPGYSVATTADNATQWATNFGAYALAPNGAAPALTLTCQTSGFVQSGGTAVASSTVARTLIATKTLRKPVISGTAAGTRLPRQPDEIDNGDGTITVRIALSQHVYAGDTGLVLTALAGWRTGAVAASGVAVSNNSTVLAPAPIVRWADVPYKLQGSAFPLEVVVASHHPKGLAPVAGIRFTVTDGTTVKSFWATALVNSAYAPSTDGTGKPLRVYGVTVDPTTATALTRGLLRCDFEVYPWLGPVQKSDVAGTKSMTNLGTAASSTSAFVPFVVAWNPGGAWITPRYAYVAASGATTAAAANVSTVAATAATTPLASINLAIESLRLWAVANPSTGGTVAAANGQAAITQSLDGCRIRLAAGATLGTGTTAVTSGAQTAATWLVIEGDPADASPRVDCILRTPVTANGACRITRVRLTSLSVEAGVNPVCAGPSALWLDNIELRGAAGQTTTTTTPFGTTGSVMFVTNARWWQYGVGAATSGTSQNPVLLRNISVERAMNAPAIFNCARLPSALSATTAGGTTTAAGINVSPVLTPSSDAGASLERLVVGCDLRYLNGAAAFGLAALAYASAPASLTLGKTYPVASRQAVINNVGEVYGVTNPMFQSIGENNCVVATENIVEGNTLAGDRTNCPYNDLNLATIALNDSEDCLVRVNRFANNVICKNASKHDAFNDPSVAAQRQGINTGGYTFAVASQRNKAKNVGDEQVVAGAPANIYHCTTAGTTAATGGPTGTGSAITDGTVVWQWVGTESRQHGYRPQATGAWPSHYGVMYEGNIDLMGANDSHYDPEFVFEFYGVGSEQLASDGLTIAAVPFTADASGTTQRLDIQPAIGTGGGNYRPLATGAGTYILGRAKTANVDTDTLGVARALPFAAGAIEGVTVAALLPAGDRQASLAASPLLGWSTTLATARAAMASRAAASATGWATLVVAAKGTLPTRAAATVTAWATTVAAAPAALASRAAASLTGWGTTVAASAGRLASRASATVAGWFVASVPDSDRSTTRTAATVTTWQGVLFPDFDRSPTLASAPLVAAVGQSLIVADFGRMAIDDRTLTILSSAMTTPAERTLIVGDGFTVACIA